MSKKTELKTRFVDIPELSETFADSIHTFSFDVFTSIVIILKLLNTGIV